MHIVYTRLALRALPIVALLVACGDTGGGAADADAGSDAVATVEDVFCGARERVRLVDRDNTGTADTELERGAAQTCWRFVVDDGGAFELFERLPSTVEGRPDGYCRVSGTLNAAGLGTATRGDCFWYELRDGLASQQRMTVSPGGDVAYDGVGAVTASFDLDTTLVGGDQVFLGRATLAYDGARDTTPAYDPAPDAGNLGGDPGACDVAGCWAGTVALLEQQSCPNGGTDPPVGQPFEYTVAADYTAIVPIGGAPLPAALDIDRCAAVTNFGSRLDGQWRLTIARTADGATVTARWLAVNSACERTLESAWTRCAP